MAGPGGAGRGGGILFIAVLAFVAYLVATALGGLPRAIVLAVLTVAIVLLTANVLRRR